MGHNNPNSTASTRLHQQIINNTAPPDDQGGWQAFTIELLNSAAYKTLSINANKALMRIVIEHIVHGRCENGNLIVTHLNFIEHGCTSDLVADAIAELEYKGLIKVRRGRGGSGTNHPNRYTLTFTGDRTGASATNEWKRITDERSDNWKADRKKLSAKRSKSQPVKKNSPIGNFQGLPLSKNLASTAEIRNSPSENTARKMPRAINTMAGNEPTQGGANQKAQSPSVGVVINNIESSQKASSIEHNKIAEIAGGWEFIIFLTGRQLNELTLEHRQRPFSKQSLLSHLAALRLHSEEGKGTI